MNKCCKNCTKYAFIGPYAYNSTVTEVYFFNLLSLCLATVEKITTLTQNVWATILFLPFNSQKSTCNFSL